MMTRLLDLMVNAQKHKVEQSFFLNNPDLCPSVYLKLLSKKIGYDYQVIVYEQELRTILQAFKYLVSYKGSLKGISETVNLFMNIKHEYFRYSISVDNEDAIIYIDLQDDVISDLSVLTDILRYILPCGYRLKYRYLVSATISDEIGHYGEKYQISVLNSINNTAMSIKSIGDEYVADNLPVAERTEGKIINAFNTMQVVSKEQIDNWEDDDKYIAYRIDLLNDPDDNS